jgi:hypothetical protein
MSTEDLEYLLYHSENELKCPLCNSGIKHFQDYPDLNYGNHCECHSLSVDINMARMRGNQRGALIALKYNLVTKYRDDPGEFVGYENIVSIYSNIDVLGTNQWGLRVSLRASDRLRKYDSALKKTYRGSLVDISSMYSTLETIMGTAAFL